MSESSASDSDRTHNTYTIKAYGYNVNGNFLKVTFNSDYYVNIGFEGEDNGFAKHLRHGYPVSVECYNSHGDYQMVSFEPEEDTYVYIDEFDELIINDKEPLNIGSCGYGCSELCNTVLEHITETSRDNHIDYGSLGWDGRDELVAGNKEMIRGFSADYLETVRRIINNLDDMWIVDTHSDGGMRTPIGVVFDSNEVLVII